MITQIIKFIRVLGSEAEPIQISMAIALAMIAGLTPMFSLHNLIVIFILLTFRVNLAAFLLAWVLFSGMSYLFDPVFHQIGLSLLNNESLHATWTTMYNTMFWRMANFNNTIVMGSLVVSLVLFLPLLLISNILIKQYRSNVLDYLSKSKIARFLQTSKLLTRFSSVMES